MSGLFIPEGKAIATKAKFDGVAQGGTPKDFDLGAIAEAHFKQSPAQLRITAHSANAAASTHAQCV
jgi:hypothetical protein